jgi:hypothetical protein
MVENHPQARKCDCARHNSANFIKPSLDSHHPLEPMKLPTILPVAIRLLLFAVVFNIAAAASPVSTFNFDTDALGTATSFTDTASGLSATFSSSGDPGGFVVYPSIFATLTGNVLGDPGPAGLDNLTLNIAFDQSLAAITFNFATSDFVSPSPLTLTAYENSTPVGSVSSTGAFPPGFSFPEGKITFSGTTFNNVVISSTAMDFAVDNIAVAIAPEPGTTSLLLTGLLVTGMPWLRSQLARRAANQ